MTPRLVICSCVLLAPSFVSAQEAKKPAGAIAEMRLIDNSKIMLSLLDQSVPIQTPHGKLLVPMADVRKIELAFRLPDETAKQIEAAVGDLAASGTRERDAAGERLLKLGPKAYPAVVRASKGVNRELAITARRLLEKFQEAFPDDRLPRHNLDVIHTDEAKIAGRIELANVRVLTPQFGEKTLKLSHIISLRVDGSGPEPETIVAQPGPDNLSNFEGQVGKVYHFKVTGANNGSVYGTDLYTLDSSLATAAVHAGVLKVGEAGTVKVTIAVGQQSYQATTRHGITSYGWGPYRGSYKVSKVGP